MRRTLLLVLTLVLLAASPAAAQSLDEAKVAGYVGERIDGYVGVVPGAPGGVAALVERINAGRRAEYARIAQQQNVDVGAVAQLAGAKLIQRAPPGQYVFDASGSWKQK